MAFDQKAYMKEYRQRPEVKERKKEVDRAWYKRNRDVVCERERQKRIEKGDEIRAKEAAYWEKNREKLLEKNRRWREENPEKVKEVKRRDYERNKTKRLATMKNWAEKNRERARELYTESYYRNLEHNRALNVANEAKRRALKNNAPVLADKESIAQRVLLYGGCCWICGEAYEEIDHVKPLSKGGAHIPANLRPICAHCNRKKSARWKGAREMKVWAANIGVPLREVRVAPAKEKEPKRIEKPSRERTVPARSPKRKKELVPA